MIEVFLIFLKNNKKKIKIKKECIVRLQWNYICLWISKIYKKIINKNSFLWKKTGTGKTYTMHGNYNSNNLSSSMNSTEF